MMRHATAPAPSANGDTVLSVDPAAGGNEVGVIVRQGDVVREIAGFHESNAVSAIGYKVSIMYVIQGALPRAPSLTALILAIMATTEAIPSRRMKA